VAWPFNIDIVINNAGIFALTGGVLTKSMVKRKSGGKIINLASMYSIFGSGLVPSYSAAKGAIVQLTQSHAIELAPHNIQRVARP
jgi:2-deoxy-D-gluconate 3-dehydrogenase